jgi:hypothetical protein
VYDFGFQLKVSNVSANNAVAIFRVTIFWGVLDKHIGKAPTFYNYRWYKRASSLRGLRRGRRK